MITEEQLIRNNEIKQNRSLFLNLIKRNEITGKRNREIEGVTNWITCKEALQRFDLLSNLDDTKK